MVDGIEPDTCLAAKLYSTGGAARHGSQGGNRILYRGGLCSAGIAEFFAQHRAEMPCRAAAFAFAKGILGGHIQLQRLPHKIGIAPGQLGVFPLQFFLR